MIRQPPRSPFFPHTTLSRSFVDTYFVTCHNQRAKTAGLLLDTMDLNNVSANAEAWEKVVIKLRAGLMPPSGVRRPQPAVDRKSTRLNSSHQIISYAVFCLKK